MSHQWRQVNEKHQVLVSDLIWLDQRRDCLRAVST